MTTDPQARGPTFALAACLGLAALGCGPSGNLASQLAQPPELELEGQTQCQVTKSQHKPLIVEWPSADRAELEATAQSRVVVVAYQGCEMRLLPHCIAPGQYTYTAVTPKQDTIRIRNADELYAAIPMGAASFEAKLAAHGQLTIALTMVGRWSTEQIDVGRGQLQGRCEGATHIIAGLTVGAFEFFAGAEADVGAGAEVVGVGAGARTGARRETLTKDGSAGACQQQGDTTEGPPPGCAALLRVEVVSLTDRTAPAAKATPLPVGELPGPQPAAEPPAAPCPAGTSRKGRYCKCPARHLWDRAQCVAVAEPAFPKAPAGTARPLLGRWRGLGQARGLYVFYADGTCWWAVAGARGDEWLGEGELCVNTGCRYLVSGSELDIFLRTDQTRCTDTTEPEFPAETEHTFRLEQGHLILTQDAGQGETYRSVFVRASGPLLGRP